MAHGIPARLTAAEGRKFAFTVGAALLVFAAIAWWRGHPTTTAVLGTIGGALGLAGLVAPSRLGPLEKAWMGLAHLIAKVTTPIFMGIVFFLVITPVSLIMRLVGKVPMRSDPAATTYWHTRPEGARRSDLDRQF